MKNIRKLKEKYQRKSDLIFSLFLYQTHTFTDFIKSDQVDYRVIVFRSQCISEQI